MSAGQLVRSVRGSDHSAWSANLAQRSLAQPPKLNWIVRPATKGQLVVRFYIPTKLTPRAARDGSDSDLITAQNSYLARRSEAFAVMRAQWGSRAFHSYTGPLPLVGRPHVRFTRFSSGQPYVGDEWHTILLETLAQPNERYGMAQPSIGLLPSPPLERCDVHYWWEPGRRQRGCVVVEVWSG